MQGVTKNLQSYSKLGSFVLLLKKNWFLILVLLGVILLFPFFYRYIKNQLQLNKSQDEEIKGQNQVIENVNPETRKEKADKITLNLPVQNAANELAHHLGTKYSDTGNWYDILNPRGWSENDKEVLAIVKFQVRNFHLLERLYFEVYTKRRNLKDDIIKLLDPQEVVQLKEYFKKYNRIW